MRLEDKTQLLAQLVARLQKERNTLEEATKATYEAATHEEAAAENKYDTRGLEASYLAGAQSKRTAEIEQAIRAFERITPRLFGEETPLALGAVVKLENEDDTRWYILGPHEGGLKITWEDREIVVITPPSPLGQQLIGNVLGEVIEIKSPAGLVELEITEVF